MQLLISCISSLSPTAADNKVDSRNHQIEYFSKGLVEFKITTENNYIWNATRLNSKMIILMFIYENSDFSSGAYISHLFCYWNKLEHIIDQITYIIPFDNFIQRKLFVFYFWLSFITQPHSEMRRTTTFTIPQNDMNLMGFVPYIYL